MKLRWMVSILVIATLLASVTASAMLPAPAHGKGSGKPEKVVFIHYRNGFAKPVTDCGNGICEPGENANKCPADCGSAESSCYTFLGRGVKWKDLPQGYVIDPDNPDNLSQSFVTGAISAGAGEWDSHTSANLFGSYSVDHGATWDDDAPDGRNEMVFGDYPQSGVIAVTVTWGYFSGPPSQRRIIEFDVLFDTDFVWGDAAANPSVMDLQNIATHEIGHGLGLGDLYNSACAEETMYGYSWEGDIQKRDLNAGDITGIQELYGA